MAKQACICIAMLCFVLTAAGCSSAPPPEVVVEGGQRAFYYLGANGGFDRFDIINTNHYDKVIKDERVYFYEYIYKDKKTGETNGLSSTVGIVKRGNSWYFLK